jgi:hypothetical protein
MHRPKSPLTKFILSLSSTLPAAEVVEKAKAAGFATNPENVTQVRSRARSAAAKGTKKAAPKKAATKAPPAPAKKTASKAAPPAAKPTPKPAAKPTPNPESAGSPKPLAKTAAPAAAAKAGSSQSKSEFIRSLPTSVAVNEVVARAKAAGHDLRAHLVYEVRRMDRLRSGHTQKPAKAVTAPKAAPVAVHAKPAAAPKPVAPRAHGSTEDLLRAVAAELGLARSIEILTAQRQGVLRVLGG